jgi:Peptidase family M1 domain/Tetratricopeptide repeat-like domain
MSIAALAGRSLRATRGGPFRPLGLACAVVLALLAAVPSHAADKQRLQVNSYEITAELQPRTHRLVAHAVVKFTALEDISVATFELHNALRPTKVVDAAGRTLSAERISQDNAVRVALPDGLQKGQSSTLTFDYEGTLASADDSPVQGLKLAYVGEDTSYLLYSGRWFPMVGYGTNRFTATIRLTVPSNWLAIGSGLQGGSASAALRPRGLPEPAEPRFVLASYQQDQPPVLKRGRTATAPAPRTNASRTNAASADKSKAPPAQTSPAAVGNTRTYTFVWNTASFPGTIIAGQFVETTSNAAGLNLHLYFKPAHKDLASQYTDIAVKEFQYYAARLGPPLSNTLRIVELPDDTLPTAWAPEVAALAGHALLGKANYRLLANTVAHQWYGVTLSPASKGDWWISDGFARYEEARYVEYAAGQTAFEDVVKDMEVGALAYDTVPLSSAGRLDTFAPEFQALTTDKGAIILNMLRWVIGDAAFDKSVQQFVKEYRGKSVTVDDLRKIAETNYGDKLTWFFAQWLDSTGAPEFKSKYTVYRVAKGFRVVGEIAQDLDLFRMPVELKIETDGQTETKRVEVVGTNSAFTVETFGRPRRIVVDPGNRVLKNSAELRVRASILRGQGLVEQGDLAGALQEFQKSLENNKNSSLAHYRIAEVFFLQHNYQAAANSYRECLNGDGEPRWTEVWSHIQLGKIFDITGQRERATNEYRQALQTNDNTQGAMDEARKYLQSPYARDAGSSNGY